MSDMREVTLPITTDRSAIAIAEILAQMASTMASERVTGLKINGIDVDMTGDGLELEIKTDGKTITYSKDGGLKVANGVFYTVI